LRRQTNSRSYRALEVVAKEPRVAPARIAVMGFSQGAAAALYSSIARFQKMYGSPDLQFVGLGQGWMSA